MFSQHLLVCQVLDLHEYNFQDQLGLTGLTILKLSASVIIAKKCSSECTSSSSTRSATTQKLIFKRKYSQLLPLFSFSASSQTQT